MKDARRRMVESMLSSVNLSEKTQDNDMELSIHHFSKMIEDMNEIGASNLTS